MEKIKKVLDTLCEMGFEVENLENTVYGFMYEDIHFLYLANETDENFLSLTIPNVLEKSDIPEEQYIALTENINMTLKYVKTYTMGDNMWFFYERELFDEENLEPIITSMIYRLEAAMIFLYNELHGEEDAEEIDETSKDKNE